MGETVEMELSESDRLKWAARRFVARIREAERDRVPRRTPEEQISDGLARQVDRVRDEIGRDTTSARWREGANWALDELLGLHQ